MVAQAERLDPESLVARIIEELQASPEAQALLLRALLTNEFLGMPARLERVEADVAEMKIDIAALKADIAELKTDVAVLKGDGLEAKAYRQVRSLLSQKFDLRRSQIMHSTLQETSRYLFEPVESALDSGSISEAQESRIQATDIIFHAQRKADRSPIWVAVEVSNDISQNDIERAYESAEALGAIFPEDVMAVVAGYGIRSEDEDRAARANVQVLLVS
jgi:hypothetical protein